MLKTFFCTAVLLCSLNVNADSNISIFGGGPFYHDVEKVVPLVRQSGFKTVILWTLHINRSGDLIFNDDTIVRNGEYVGNSDWPGQIERLKGEGSSVTRVEFSVGSWGAPDFENVRDLIKSQGVNETGVLYRNFAALKKTLGVLDAISFDDETSYDLSTSIAFSLMLGRLGYKVSLCPYVHVQFWGALFHLVNRLAPGLIDTVYLQAYGGGTGVNPAVWNRYFNGLKVQVGLWSQNGANCSAGQSPAQMAKYFRRHVSHLGGGWVWLLDDVLKCNRYSLSDYAHGIDDVFKD